MFTSLTKHTVGPVNLWFLCVSVGAKATNGHHESAGIWATAVAALNSAADTVEVLIRNCHPTSCVSAD